MTNRFPQKSWALENVSPAQRWIQESFWYQFVKFHGGTVWNQRVKCVSDDFCWAKKASQPGYISKYYLVFLLPRILVTTGTHKPAFFGVISCNPYFWALKLSFFIVGRGLKHSQISLQLLFVLVGNLYIQRMTGCVFWEAYGCMAGQRDNQRENVGIKRGDIPLLCGCFQN